jgi:hypothetical protein
MTAAPQSIQPRAEPARQKAPPKPTFDPAYIRDLSEKVYRLRLEQDCDGNVERMIAKDEDGGEKLRNRAGAYDPLTRAYLKVLGFEPAALPKQEPGA